jgi:Na+-transporting NADH:ubiquinone oxidoreductase subunit NqrB
MLIARRDDPRWLQIGSLGGLLLYGLLALDLEVGGAHAIAAVAGALFAQRAWSGLRGEPFDPASALISGLSLGLLLRAAHPGWLLVAGGIAISSKYLLRAGGRHWFNPTNFTLVVLLLAGAPVWVSGGQWGSLALAAFALTCVGHLISMRARRSDVTWVFLGCWAALLFGRALWLGDPAGIPLHQLQSGALLIFAFFMISDPRTTPASRPGRILFAFGAAGLAGWIQFGLHRPNALLWGLAGVSLLRPLIDSLLPAEPYQWPGRRLDVPLTQGESRENPEPADPDWPLAARTAARRI